MEDDIFDDKLDKKMIMDNDIGFVIVKMLNQYKFYVVNLDMVDKTITFVIEFIGKYMHKFTFVG